MMKKLTDMEAMKQQIMEVFEEVGGFDFVEDERAYLQTKPYFCESPQFWYRYVITLERFGGTSCYLALYIVPEIVSLSESTKSKMAEQGLGVGNVSDVLDHTGFLPTVDSVKLKLSTPFTDWDRYYSIVEWCAQMSTVVPLDDAAFNRVLHKPLNLAGLSGLDSIKGMII